jgi:hypothetical protein
VAQILSVFAELERRLIGERTKAALAVKRSQSVKLGRRWEAARQGGGAHRERTGQGAHLDGNGHGLNADRVPTAQGGLRWYPATVRSVAMSASRRLTKAR